MKSLVILGTRGIPASHGGFETFAEHLSSYLVEKGWKVTIYCQDEGKGPIYESDWNGIRRIHIPVVTKGALGTIIFDWKATIHSLKEHGLLLVLGYNTAIFNVVNRIKHQKMIFNMDGFEWKRQKWNWYEKLWLHLNEYSGGKLSTVMVADHPCIKNYLDKKYKNKQSVMIPYGANEINHADDGILPLHGVKKYKFAIVIARPEPENSILTIVKGFSAKKRGIKLIVLGNYDFETNPYHKKIKQHSSNEVIFPGAIYDQDIVASFRYYSLFYIHGHTAGGTNPSLVEAMGAGCMVLAHDNQFNRWVLDNNGYYFKTHTDVSEKVDKILTDSDQIEKFKNSIRIRHKNIFTWQRVLQDYESIFNKAIQ